MTTPFPGFHKSYPPDAAREAFDPARHDRFAALVPAELAEEWRGIGFGGYGGGFLWTVPPDKPVLDPRDWPFLDGTGVEVVRSALGCVCVLQNGALKWLDIYSGDVTDFMPRVDLLFESSLRSDGFRRDLLFETLFGQAKERFGALTADEVYGFAPLPAIGGAIDEKYLMKTVLRDFVALAGHVLSR